MRKKTEFTTDCCNYKVTMSFSNSTVEEMKNSGHKLCCA